MAAASTRAQVLRLYRALLRESEKFTSYGFRTYAIRRIRDAFRENKNLKNSAEIETLVNNAKTNLEMIHRQVSTLDTKKQFVTGPLAVQNREERIKEPFVLPWLTQK